MTFGIFRKDETLGNITRSFFGDSASLWITSLSLRLIRRQSQQALHISRGMKNAHDLKRLGFMTIDDQIRIDQQETVSFVG